ncbi:GlxA family transcriptional regulator [Acuticoccus sp. M5D2P5]|uniref:GlxA family transcriptional regulator n=1 Tax=Acuticoccus kalidii TaxID=2910977 RepID=UPI001F25DBD1|nr:GlxA family transcriptional regulator [Acuticoccus kalidii]MCF3932216.1 GlxA family transcriptional regulator [Acuticoccus kalidii]
MVDTDLHRIADDDGGGIRTKTILVVLVDAFSLLSLASFIEPFRSANRILGQAAYDVQLATLSGAPAMSSGGIAIAPGHALADAPPANVVMLCTGLIVEPPGRDDIVAQLRRRVRAGECVGAIATGAWLLGAAKLLDGYRATIHWESRAAFAAAHPEVDVTESLYEIDRTRLTSAGGTASIDLVAAIVTADHGVGVSRQMANLVQHERIRAKGDRQRPANEPDLVGKPEAIARIIQRMAANLEDPLAASVLADEAGLSVRQVERLFRRHVEMTPTAYYIRLRLTRARELLRQTSASILDVAIATGFSSQSHFAQAYRGAFGISPSEERRGG